MKALRVLILITVVAVLLGVTASAVVFTPSVERKDGPELIEPTGGDDELIITPVSELENDDLHEDIRDNLTEAKENLSDSEWAQIVKDFEELWEEFTDGAPIEHAVVSDIFDVRFLSELGVVSEDGKTVTFKIKIQGLEADDIFMIITESDDPDHYMEIVSYTIDENGVITITATSKSAFAVVRDSCPDPKCDHDSPKTGVPAYLAPAVFGAVIFGALAVACAFKLKKASAK